MRSFIILLGLLATPATASDQFDFVCKGEYRERTNASWTLIESRYRIDLATGAWCNGTCTEVRKIISIDPGEFVLDRTAPGDGDSPYSSHEISRTAGTYRLFASDGHGSYWEEQGRCEPAPFTGMPEQKF